MSLIQTIEADLQAAGKWLEGEFETAAKEVWAVVTGIFNGNEPTVVANVLASVKAFLGTVAAEIATGTPLDQLEQNFLQWAETEAASIVSQAKTLGSTLLQALIALAIKDINAVKAAI